MDDLVQEEWGVAYFQAPTTLLLLQCIGNSRGHDELPDLRGRGALLFVHPVVGAVAAHGRQGRPQPVSQPDVSRPATRRGAVHRREAISPIAGGPDAELAAAPARSRSDTDPDAARLAIGDEEAQTTLDYVFSGGSGAGDIDALIQPIESVAASRGQDRSPSPSGRNSPTVGGLLLGVNWSQIFGTGGTPSASIAGIAQVFPSDDDMDALCGDVRPSQCAGQDIRHDGGHRFHTDCLLAVGGLDQQWHGGRDQRAGRHGEFLGDAVRDRPRPEPAGKARATP